MGYILGLFLILGLVFYSVGNFGFNLSGNIFEGFRDKVKNTMDSTKNKLSSTIFPKSENEILIDKVESDYNFLDKFFAESAPKILQSKDVAEKDKEAVRQAATKFEDAKKSIQIIKAIEKNDKGIIEKLVDKIFNNDSALTPEATYIPAQCRLECSE